MALPTLDQQRAAIDEQIKAVGKLHVSAYEVALKLDARFPGMTNQEFAQLQLALQSEVAAARGEGLQAVWGESATA